MERVLVEDNSAGSAGSVPTQKTKQEVSEGRLLVEDNSIGGLKPKTIARQKTEDKFGFLGLPKTVDTWKDVGEGAVIAASNTTPVDTVRDLTLGAGAGINDLFANVINMFDDDNAAADFFKRGSALLRDKMDTKGGIADAVGSEAGQMAVTAPVGSAGGELIGKVVKKPLSSAARSVSALFGDQGAKSSKALRGIYKIGDDISAGRRVDTNPSIEGYKIPKDFDISEEIISRGVKGAPDTIQPPIISVAGLTKYFDKLVGKNTPYSRELAQQAESLVKQGHSPEEALLQVLNAYGKAAGKYKNAGTQTAKAADKAGTMAALFGTQLDN